MRPAIRKPKKALATKRPDEAKALILMRHWVQQALEEVKLSRGFLERQYSGPEHEHLEWAQHALENALNGKSKPR